MNTRPLPRTAGRVPVVALAAVVVLLAAPAVLLPGLSGGAPTPLWFLGCGLGAQVALFGLHVRLFVAHRRGTHHGVVLDATASWACFTAVLFAVALEPLAGLTGLGAPATALSLVCAAGAFAGLGVAVVSGTVIGWERDRRLAWAAAAALLSPAVVVHEVVPPTVEAFGGPVGSALLALLCLGAFTGLVLTPAPERTAPVPPRWREQVAYSHVVGSLALLVVGAQALLPGEPHPVVVVPALLAVLVVGLRLTVLARLVGELQGSHEVALTDDLTGLGNRRALLSRLGEALRHEGEVALLVLDLDRFKHVNDGLGHHTGDELLRQVADVLSSAVEGRALLARLGGDEFAVLLLEVSEEHAETVAWRVHTALAVPFQVMGRSVHAPASVGLAFARGGQDRSASGSALDLLRRADTAMYAAKAAKAGPVTHDLHLDRTARDTLRTGEELRRAFDRGELLLHFQPQVDVASGALRGAEALVRWNHPERGLLAPDAFVRVAEELGLVGRLTEVVLEAAVGQAAAWHREGAEVPVSVNLSAADVGPALVPAVSSLLHGSGLPPRLLVLEITETTLVVDPGGVAAVLRDLVELGVEISIDDFGTGYSSLTLLLQLPVAEVKIDRSFVAELGRDAGSGTVVRTTVDLAHSLGMRVVAEGVEDDDVLAHLAGLGCDVSQGFLHSRPLPADEATDWILGQLRRSPTLQA